MEKLRKRRNISPEGGFLDVPTQEWYVHSPIYNGGIGEAPLAHATRVFGYMSLAIILTGETSSSCAVMFFGRPGYKTITVAAHINHLPRSPISEACLFLELSGCPHH